MSWIDKDIEMPNPNNADIEVLCSDGEIRRACAAEIGGFMVDATQDFINKKMGDYEVTHWRYPEMKA